ncbi:MAG: methyl-accepting chemotaxis protein, partial [Rhodocyclaceae bacterium]
MNDRLRRLDPVNLLAIVLAVVMIMFLGASAVALNGMGQIGTQFGAFMEREQPLSESAYVMLSAGLQTGQALRNIALDRNNRKAYENLETAHKEFEAALKASDDLASNDPALRAMLKEIAVLRGNLQPIQKDIVERAQTDQAGAVAMINTKETPAWRELKAQLLKLVKALNAGVEHRKTSVVTMSNQALTLSLACSALAAMVGTVLGWLIVRALRRQLGGDPSYAVECMKRFAEGDLGVCVKTREGDKSSLLYALKSTVERLAGIMTEVRTAADSLSAASEQVSATSQRLSQGASEQAASVEETSAAVEEMSASIAQNTENAKVTDGMASNAARDAEHGGQAVSETA